MPLCLHYSKAKSSTTAKTYDETCGLLVRLRGSIAEYQVVVEEMADTLDADPLFDTACRFSGGTRCPKFEARS